MQRVKPVRWSTKVKAQRRADVCGAGKMAKWMERGTPGGEWENKAQLQHFRLLIERFLDSNALCRDVTDHRALSETGAAAA